jgi:hypothetical protein
MMAEVVYENVDGNEFQKKDPTLEIERKRALSCRDRASTIRSRSKTIVSDVNDKTSAEDETKVREKKHNKKLYVTPPSQ